MAMNAVDKQKLLDKMRNRQKAAQGGRDPSEWRPDKVKKDEKKEYRVIVLPPLSKGDATVDGPCESDWDLWYIPHGHHFVNGKRYECPRVHVEQGDCSVCSMGFDLMRETTDKPIRSALAKEWLSRGMHAVNIYFEDHKSNPEDLRGQVKWWSMPDAVWKKGCQVLDSNDAGDQDDPRAFGMFFDEENAFPLKVVVSEKSDYNNYEESVFIGKPRPLAEDAQMRATILAKRVDVNKKFDARDAKLLDQLLEAKTSGALAGNDGKTEKPAASAPKQESAQKTETKAPVSEAKSEVKLEKPAAKAEVKEQAKVEPAKEAAGDVDDDEMKALLSQLT